MSSLRYPQKVVLVGDSNVGKSTLIHQLTTRTFLPDWKPTTTCRSSVWQTADGTMSLAVWDTPGNPNFNFTLGSACRNIEGVMLVYDVTMRATFDHITDWLQYVTAHSPPHAVLMLVGTRTDKDREVSAEVGQQLACELNATFLEVTATDGNAVAALFEEMARLIAAGAKEGETR